jgi:Flp pilus assembly protein TadB
MAQTKRKRRSKHRGTAAGTIQTRGRTGRPTTADEKKKEARATTRERRLNTPPTWQGSFKRALLASSLMFVFILLTNSKSKNPVVAAVAFAAFALLLYVPAGYYLELFLYKRRQRRKTVGR